MAFDASKLPRVGAAFVHRREFKVSKIQWKVLQVRANEFGVVLILRNDKGGDIPVNLAELEGDFLPAKNRKIRSKEW